jgi:hypothetical protein
MALAMTICREAVVTRDNDAYWVDDNAAQPVLLVDEATESITEALHRVRSGSVLDDRDLAAVGVALSDLFGGLGQLADLLASSVGEYANADLLEVGWLEDRLATLRAMTLPAREAAKGLRLATIRPISDTG